MRKFLTVVRVVIFLLVALPGTAQQNPGTPAAFQRCGTSEHLTELIKRDPTLKARMDADQERLNQALLQKIQERRMNKNAATRLDAVVTIPVVVHIVLSNPNLITDADVIWQLNKLNEDFAGKNADSVNAGSFASLFGHSQIQFCLAQQDEIGNPTNGIERITSTNTFTRLNPEIIKSTSTCGANAWDVNRYFNIWVGSASDGTLGIATFPNTGVSEYQGIAITYQGFGNNPAYVSPSYSLGRTAVHEAGHFFYARHIWGDGSCASDFPSIAGLPSFTDDTPSQSEATSGCPSGVVASGCTDAPTPPGRMYQNFMDYTNDACYCMFTLNQVARMEAALDIFRSSLKTSNACTPAIIVPNDASVSKIISPAASGSCSSTGNNSFCSPDFSPRVTIKNYGSANLTSVIIYAQVDNLPAIATNWTGNLAQLATVSINLTTVSASNGTHTLKIYVSDPNGAADGKNANDTLYTSFTILSATPLTIPLTEGFEGITFPPTDWKINNLNDGSVTWERTTDAAKSGTASAIMRLYEYSTRLEEDYLLSPLIDVTAADSIILNFERAYRVFDASADFADTLAVVISVDCGNTFTEVWKRGGTSLATVTGVENSTGYVPATEDWVNTHIDLKLFSGTATQILAGFKTVNKFGQNLYLDDINIEVFRYKTNDAAITKITEPFGRLCERTFKPVIQLTNKGSDTLKNTKIIFLVDNMPVDSVNWTGSLKTGAFVNVEGTKNITITTGNQHSLTAYLVSPNGLPDDKPVDDTARLTLFVSDIKTGPLQEGFEQTIFPPGDWSVESPGDSSTWERTTLAASEKTAAAWIWNYGITGNNKHDDLFSLPVQTAATFDSAYIRFDVAHVSKPPAGVGTTFDTLEVLLTTDCGKTFTTVYKKWGLALQTITNPPATFDPNGFVPGNTAQWRTELLDVTQFVPKNSKFQAVFRNTGNNGNNIFLDNINLYTVQLPARLKSEGYLISPNPFNGSFTIRHVTPPVELKGIEVFTSSGQLVYRQQFKGNANTYQQVNLSRYSSGLYIVKLVYDKKVITERIVKL